MSTLSQIHTFSPMADERPRNGRIFACWTAFCIVFLMYEGFFILPDAVVVPLPGQFRIADVAVLVFFLSFTVFLFRTLRIIREHTEASLLVLSSCWLFFFTAYMAELSFGQPLIAGLLYLRHSFNYLLFFVILTLLETEEDMRLFIRMATACVAVLAVLAVVQKYVPSLPIFNFRSIGTKQYLDKRNIRLGDFRLFFPNIEFAFLFYFLTLAELLNTRKNRYPALMLCFLLLMTYIVMANATRAYVITLAFVTLIAFVTGRKKSLKIIGIILLVLGGSAQALSVATTQEGVSLFEQNKLSMIVKASVDTKEGSIQGRVFQNAMYLENFLKSPVMGVGTLRYNPDLAGSYRRFRFYGNDDLGYVKMLAEYGVVGMVWLLWFYVYAFRRTGQVVRASFTAENDSFPGVIGKGLQLFFLYVAITMVTIPHFIEGDRIIPLVLAMVFLEIVRQPQQVAAAQGNAGERGRVR